MRQDHSNGRSLKNCAVRKSTKKQLRELMREANLFASRRDVRGARKVLNEIARKFVELEKRLGAAGGPSLQTLDRAAELEELFVEFLKHALHEDDGMEKQPAGKVLGRLYVSQVKHHRKLTKVNPAYQEMVAKLGKIRTDVLLPESPVGQILQEELRTAEHYRFKLLLLRELLKEQKDLLLVSVDKEAVQKRQETQKAERKLCRPSYDVLYPGEFTSSGPYTWKDAAREKRIPEEYWPLVDFPDLSLKSSKKWWAFIWSQIKEKQDKLLPRLRERGKGRAEAKIKLLYLKHFQKEFQNHWKTLVSYRAAGIF
jgi:hypothetical protein